MVKLSFKEVFKTDFFTVESTDSQCNEYGPYYRIKSNDSVIVCLINEKNNLILVNQFRENLQQKTLEFPAGQVDNSEDIYHAAKREVFEETGFGCELVYIGKSRLLMNRYINHEYLFIGLVKNENILDLNKNILMVDRVSFVDYVKNNKFEQLAALGLINFFDIQFNLNFFNEPNLYHKINILREKQNENSKN